MKCNKCEVDMDYIGYGDYLCPECGAVKQEEPSVDFEDSPFVNKDSGVLVANC